LLESTLSKTTCESVIDLAEQGDSQEVRCLCIVGINCFLGDNSSVECSALLDKQIAVEEEEIEMLVDNYLHM
ncbi:hypothetical protein Tco_0995809, partial [Tanacetum coccineum]